MRWKQWIKNLLVFAPWFASGEGDSSDLSKLVLAFISFSLLSSSIYIFNDLHDVEEDRRHPDKSRRPIAAGLVSFRRAQIYGAVTLLGALVLAITTLNSFAVRYMAIYLGVSVLYITLARNIFLLDIFVVASGFVLRILFGGSVSETPISPWLLVIIGSFALFIVTGKRFSEVKSGNALLSGRKSLQDYSMEYLQAILISSLSATLISYALWTIEGATNSSIAILSMVPFTFILLRYLSTIYQGKAEAPEQTLLKDPVLIISGFVWIGVFYSRFL
jgi:decaprenyl-phosphate phosphoribosyltransferase